MAFDPTDYYVLGKEPYTKGPLGLLNRDGFLPGLIICLLGPGWLIGMILIAIFISGFVSIIMFFVWSFGLLIMESFST